MLAHNASGGLLIAGFLAAAVSAFPEPLRAQADPCIANQYRLCMGNCPAGSTDQGECTTRLNSVGGTEVRWCCCPDSYNTWEGDATTPAPPGDSDRQCTDVDIQDADADTTTGEPDDKDPPPPWAATAAVNMTAQPEQTDEALTQLRLNVLEKNARTMRYVPLVYRLADEIDAIYAENPDLAERTARLLDRNLPILSRLASGENVSVSRETVQQVGALLERMAEASAASDELRTALRSARRDLRDTDLLGALGVAVQP
jgi:hypothetical protein